MCPLDDPFSRILFKNTELLLLMLDILCPEENIIIGHAETQSDVRNPGGESIAPDILITDIAHEKLIDVEFQKDNRGAGISRAVKNLSTLVTAGDGLSEEFRGCSEFYTVFVTKRDIFNQGLPIIHIENVIIETGEYIEDNCHIIYVNCEYTSDDKIGCLIHDLKCPNPNEMLIKEFAEAVRKIKNPGSEEFEMVCDAVEAYGERIKFWTTQRVTEEVTEEVTERVTEEVTERVTEEKNLEAIRNIMTNLKLSEEEAMNALNIPESEREKYRKI